MRNSGNGLVVCDALYVAWKMDPGGVGARPAQDLLAEGVSRHLYRLRSWMVARGEARALLVPAAPLEEIAGALFTSVEAPVTTRWISGERQCAAVTREIETAPVQLGLANRPEEWPLSSAWRD